MNNNIYQSKNIKIVIFALFLPSLTLNLVQTYFLLKNWHLTKNYDPPIVTSTVGECMNNTGFTKAIKKNEQMFAVYVKPHPPNFLNGRYVTYVNYQIKEIEGKKKVIFKEKLTNGFMETEVDSEAIVWK